MVAAAMGGMPKVFEESGAWHMGMLRFPTPQIAGRGRIGFPGSAARALVSITHPGLQSRGARENACAAWPS